MVYFVVYFLNYTYFALNYKILNKLKSSLESGVNMNFKVPSGINKCPLSIRVDEEDYDIIEKLSKKNNKSFNYIINSMIKYAIQNMDMKDIKKS